MKLSHLKTALAVAAVASVALFGPATPNAEAGGSPTMPCYNCKFGFNWLDSDSTSGKLQVSKRCRANRKLVLYGTPVGALTGVVSRIDRTSSNRQGNWELAWGSPRTILIAKLAPKVVRGKTCKGASVGFLGAI